MVKFRDEVVEDILFYVAHSKLLLCVLAYFGNPRTTCHNVVLADAFHSLAVEFLNVIVVHDELVGPSPLIFAVVVVDVVEAVQYVLYAFNSSALDVVEESQFLALWQEES